MFRLVFLIFLLCCSSSSSSSSADDQLSNVLKELEEKEICFELKTENLNYLRSLNVYWDPLMESGAVVLATHPSNSLYKYFLDFFNSKTHIKDLENTFQIFLNFGKINTGTYNINENDVSDYRPSIEEKLRLNKKDKFVITEAHLKLINNARGEWGEYYQSLQINPKRPFGDMSYFELDMAEILDIKIDINDQGNPIIGEAQQKIFDSYFNELPFYLSIFIKNAKVETGQYCQKPAVWGEWIKK